MSLNIEHQMWQTCWVKRDLIIWTVDQNTLTFSHLLKSLWERFIFYYITYLKIHGTVQETAIHKAGITNNRWSKRKSAFLYELWIPQRKPEMHPVSLFTLVSALAWFRKLWAEPELSQQCEQGSAQILLEPLSWACIPAVGCSHLWLSSAQISSSMCQFITPYNKFGLWQHPLQ